MNLSLFDPPPVPETGTTPSPRPHIGDDILRIITHKAGPFREVREGKETGREFRVLDLENGTRVIEWTDGSREAAPPSLSDVYLSDGVRFGFLREAR